MQATNPDQPSEQEVPEEFRQAAAYHALLKAVEATTAAYVNEKTSERESEMLSAMRATRNVATPDNYHDYLMWLKAMGND